MKPDAITAEKRPYRARKMFQNEWVYGFHSVTFPNAADWRGGIREDPPRCDVIIEEKRGHVVYIPVDHSTIGRYTGLEDSRKKPIYEGDIISVRANGKEEYRFVVMFGRCGGVQNTEHEVGYVGFYFAPANEETRRCFRYSLRDDPVYWMNAYEEVLVIGNRWDDAVLIEGGEDQK